MTTWYCSDCLHSFTDDYAACPNMACGAPRPALGWGRLLGEGDWIDRHYWVERRLAVGGAGITYLAREVDAAGAPQLPWLAIKVLFAQRDEGPFLRRLANEAQILQELDHPHILVSHGFVHRRGHAPYLVTQYEEGGTLFDAVTRGGPMPVEISLTVAAQILSALQMAHRRGVVHRDLKPQNVLLAAPYPEQPRPHVRVADFGIAKVEGAFGEGVTQVGAFVGTPEYAAPEQYKGLDATPATDLFAWGGLLFFMLTGQHPVRFSQRRDLASSYRELLEATPLRWLGPPHAAAKAVEALWAGVMAHAPAARWSSAQAHDALAAILAPPVAKPMAEFSDFAGTLVGFEDPHLDDLPAPALLAVEPEVVEAEIEEIEPAPRFSFTAAAKRPPGPGPGPVRKRSLSLDNLFDFGGNTEEDAEEYEVFAPEQTPPASPPARSEPPARAALVLGADGSLWEPADPLPLPSSLPADSGALLSLLGGLASGDRAAVVGDLARWDAARLDRALRDGTRAAEAGTRRGVGLCVAALQLERAIGGIRPLLADREASVRLCAAHAVGAVGAVGALAGLARLLTDGEPSVRAQAVLALARAGKKHGREEMVRQWLDAVRRDPHAAVAAALEMTAR